MKVRPRLVYVVSAPAAARLLLRGQLRRMREWGFDVSVVASPGDELDIVRTREEVATYPIAIPRDIDARADAKALARLVRLFRRVRPHIVNASTPKGGLLGMMAAAITRVPVRVYLLRGLRLETADDRMAAVLGATERIASACAHEVVCVSHSLRDAFLAGRYATAGRTRVLAAGSSNGIDAQRFRVTDDTRRRGLALRKQLSVPEGAPTIGFAGRPVADKGIGWLLDAFDGLRQSHPNAQLMLVGADLAGDGIAPELRTRLERSPGVRIAPFIEDMAAFYAAIDILAFPSLREGFPNVPAEAAAAEVPVVGFASTGVVDAIRDGVTGRIVPQKDSASLRRALAAYLDDPELRRAHGIAGRQWVEREFAPERVWGAWRDEYVRLLAARDLPLPDPESS